MADTKGNIIKDMREQRKWFKNLSIYHTESSIVFGVLEQQSQLKNALQSKRAKAEITKGDEELGNQKAQLPSELPKVSSDTWNIALRILVEELGVEPEDLEDSSVLTDVGLDSLLLMAILARMRVELMLDLHPSVLVKCLTVRDFRTFIEGVCATEIPPRPTFIPTATATLENLALSQNAEEKGKDDGDHGQADDHAPGI